MEEIRLYLEFIGVFIGTLLAISAFTPKGYKAVRVMFQWWKDVTLADIYERLERLERNSVSGSSE